MPKTIIINDSIINKGILNEAIEFNRLPKHLRLEILRGKTPLSGNDCFPYEGYFEKELTSTFENVSSTDVVKNGEATPDNISKIEKQSQRIETPVKNNFEMLVSNSVMEFFGIPEDKVDFSVELVASVDQSKTTAPFGPDENMPAGLASVDDIDIITKEVSKRKFQNALIAGASRYFTDVIMYGLIGNLDEIDATLYDSYVEYLLINDYLLFANDEQISEEDKHETGNVIVTLGNDETKNQLEAKGTIFPVLLYETIKGFMEIFTSHGLPSNPEVAKAVMSKSDYVLAEPWYMRTGYFVWAAFNQVLKDIGYNKRTELLPYILMKISQLNADKYIRLMKEVLAGTEKAKRVMERVCEYAETKVQKQAFTDRLAKTRSQNAFMIDDEKEQVI